MSASSSDDESDGWEELCNDDESIQRLTCLICTYSAIDTTEFFQHLTSHTGWSDFSNVRSCEIKDQYDWIRFVNYSRSKHPSTWREVFDTDLWKSESTDLMFPVLKDDPVLAIDIESFLEEANANQSNALPDGTPNEGSTNEDNCVSDTMKVHAENQFLREQLATCKRLLATLAEPPLPDAGGDTGSSIAVQQPLISSVSVDPDDSAYFCSYGHFAIHAEMINDTVRTESYRNFILSNASTLFAKKLVLDIGCGSGILSLFASEAGAAHVYGVEASSEIFAAAQETIIANKLTDRITLFRDCAEAVKLPVEQVDVIISEWMGYFLLFESMLDSVLHAALRYLAPHGRIFPRHYSIYLLGISSGSKLRRNHLDLWNNVYGYQMPALRRSALTEAQILDLTDTRVIGSSDAKHGFRILTRKPCELYTLDLDAVRKERMLQVGNTAVSDLQQAECQIELCIDPGEPLSDEMSSDSSYVLDAFVGYFDVRFDDDAPVNVSFSTSPMAPATHWKQTVFFLDNPLSVKHGDRITGTLKVSRAAKDARGLEFSLRIDQPHGKPSIHQRFSMTS